MDAAPAIPANSFLFNGVLFSPQNGSDVEQSSALHRLCSITRRAACLIEPVTEPPRNLGTTGAAADQLVRCEADFIAARKALLAAFDRHTRTTKVYNEALAELHGQFGGRQPLRVHPFAEPIALRGQVEQ